MYMQIRMPLACLLILIYIFLLSLEKKKLRTRTSRIFERIAGVGILHVLAAVVTEYTVNNRQQVSFLFNHVWHIIFLMSLTVVCALLYLYLLSYVERGTGTSKRLQKLGTILVLGISLAGELVLPITYVDTPYGSYSLGFKAYFLYLTVLYVLVMMTLTIIRYRQFLSREKSHVLVTSVGIFVAIATVQILFPYILLTDLGVTMIVLGLAVNAEDVHMFTFSDTGFYNELGCREILQETVLRGKPFQVAAYVFLGRDDALHEAMASVQTALQEKKSPVICGSLGDNLLVLIPLKQKEPSSGLFPVPACSEDATYDMTCMDFDGSVSVDDIFRKVREYKSRCEENALQRDELTGLLRRAAFIRQVEYLTKAGQSFTFLMMDIDNFKQVNDLHGHDVGDRLLQQVAGILSEQTRGSDIVCRMGGDEFGILLSGVTHPSEVTQIVTRLRDSVSKTKLDCDPSIHITMSVGAKISGGRDWNRSFRTVYIQADSALYRSKSLGKDRLTFAE